MSCRAAVRRDDGRAAALGADQHATFLELAARGDEATFKVLARCLGFGPEALDELWRRTLARLPGRSDRSRLA